MTNRNAGKVSKKLAAVTAQRDELRAALIELEGESDCNPGSPQMAAALTKARAAIARCQPAEKGDA